MTVYEMLRAENAKTLRLLRKLEGAAASQPEACRGLLLLVARQIQACTHASEHSLYSVLQQRPQTHEAALDGCEELREIEGTLRLLARVPLTAMSFRRLVQLLSAQVRQHVRHEEEEILPQAAQVLSYTDAERLAERLDQEKSDYETRLLGY